MHKPSNHRQLLWILALALVAIGGVGTLIIFILHPQTQNPPQDQPTVVDNVVASTAPFKKYFSENFTLSLPGDWKTSEAKIDANTTQLLINYQVDGDPDDLPMEIDCTSNPQGLSASQWFNANGNPALTGQGAYSLNGIDAYKATGSAESNYTAYIVTNSAVACTIYAFTPENPSNAVLIQKAVDSFTWK